jgi:hypothetical protein
VNPDSLSPQNGTDALFGQDRPQADEMIEQSLAGLFERGWLVGPDRLTITDAGNDRLRQRKGRTRWEMHRLSPGH